MIVCGDARHLPLADESVHCVVTSPPYYRQRDYGVAGQLGLEKTPDEYVAALVAVGREVRRVLRADGTFWLNLGDSYAGSGKRHTATGTTEGAKQATNVGSLTGIVTSGGKPKDLLGMPWRVAFALQADGWWLRSAIIWAKGLSYCASYSGSVMPESVRDRPTSAHEYLFLLARAPGYYYDGEAVAEDSVYPDDDRKARSAAGQKRMPSERVAGVRPGAALYPRRHLRDVWAINPEHYAGAHYAVMPTALVEPCIRAGTSERGCCPRCGAPWSRVTSSSGKTSRDALHERGASAYATSALRNAQGLDYTGGHTANIRLVETTGWEPTCDCGCEPVPCVVLDPFSGAGTTGLVASRLGRRYVGVDLSRGYCAMARVRIAADAPLLAEVVA